MRKLILIYILALLMAMVSSKDIKRCNIISNPACVFTTTDYYVVVTSFVKGIDWVKTYGAFTDSCLKESMPKMLDEFNEMAVNNTASENDWEGRMMFLSKFWSGSYANTMYNCYRWVGIVQQKQVEKYKSFKDDRDVFVSFLFNMLTNSYDIRKASYALIHYGKYPFNWPKYAENVGIIIKLLVYFDSAEASAFNIDNDSPYYYDANGDIQRKNLSMLQLDEPHNEPHDLILSEEEIHH